MAKIPSATLLAKDAIGQAVDISGVRTVQDEPRRIMDYNLAISELYNVLGFIDTAQYLEEKALTGNMYKYPKCGYIDLATILDYDKLIELEIFEGGGNTNPKPIDNADEVDYSTMSSNRSFGAAIDPYDETVIYTVVKDKIHFVIGESLNYQFNTISFNVVYRRQPKILVASQYDFELVDLPDKYWSLLVNRMASMVEYRAGIFEKSLPMVKMSYEQLLSNVDPIIKTSLLKTLEIPVGAIQ